MPGRHHVLGTPMAPPFPESMERAVFGMGCFWGAERIFWQLDGIYTTGDAQSEAADRSRALFQERLTARGLGSITTDIEPATEFYYAEEAHQQYLAKNPGGYCGLGGTGVSCPIGVLHQGSSA